MMVDQHDTSLDREYAATTARVRRFILSEFDLSILERSASEYPPHPNNWREVWQVPVSVSSLEMKLLIAIPKTFPDQLPIIYLPHDVKQSDRRIPHLNGEREFCTFDKSEIRLNADNPEGIMLRVIERAIKLLEEGVTGSNSGEYLDEFEAYWEQGATVQALSLFAPSDQVQTVIAIRLNPPWKSWSYLFTADESFGRRWLASVGYRYRPFIDQALYLPLKSLGHPPYPTNNSGLYNRLQEEDPEALRELVHFLYKQPRPTGVLFSVPAGTSNRVMGAWWHVKSVRQVGKRGKKNRNLPETEAFAPGHHPVEIELTDTSRNGKVLCATVDRVDQTRLSLRTSGASHGVFGKPVNIIGCGSVGSLAAARLAETGAVSHFRLVDHERLSIENVPRHYCGMSDVGEFKSIAIAGKLQRHFPQIECETNQIEILELLRASPSLICPASLTLVAVGELSTERRLNRLAMSATESISYCYVWVEPHLYGGHALFVKKGNGGCFECAFDEHLLFKQRIIEESGQFSMREAGCRSSYVQYGGLYVNQFVPAMIHFLLDAMNASENQTFSWSGDLEAARHKGVALAAEWTAAPSFSSFIKNLTANPSCPVCSA